MATGGTMKQSRLWVLALTVVALLLLTAGAALAQEAAAEAPAAAAAAEGEAAAVSPLVPLGINAGFLIAQIINFGIIAVLLGRFLWRPLTNMLDSRAAKIQKGLEDAAVAANARRNAEAEAEKILAGARGEVSKIIEEARARGDELAKQLEAEARAEAEKIRTEARAAAASERDAQLADLRGQVAAISMAVAQRLIGETLDEKRQQALISDFFSKVPAGAMDLSGRVEVVSAMPLSVDEQGRVKKELGASEVDFSVDPRILGGLIIRAGDRVVDGSVRSGLTELGSRLN
jgi:F-type H+-transporting ATPase subunit b